MGFVMEKHHSLSAAFACVILAAGAGTRMRSRLPKVLHPVGGQPMLGHVLDAVLPLKPERCIIATAEGMGAVSDFAQKHTDGKAIIAIQKQQQGTADALKAALPALKGYTGKVLVLYGDGPLVSTSTLASQLEGLSPSDDQNIGIVVQGADLENPHHLGRLIVDSACDTASLPIGGLVELHSIVEFKDASPAQQAITFCNTGIMAIDGGRLEGWLNKISNKNAKGEYYLTDIVEIAASSGAKCLALKAPPEEFRGVNTRAEQAEVERILQDRYRLEALARGVTLIDPENTYLSADTRFGADVVIHPYVWIGQGVSFGDNTEIRSFSHLEGAEVGCDCRIGPFARLRAGTQLGDKVKIGNFVETKKAIIGKGSQANHLSYLGDATLGEKVNIGAGTITCNYDGFDKFPTHIGSGAFIGSNTALVAPVTVGAGAIVGAGSVITNDVPSDALALTRSEQATIVNWAKYFRARKGK